MDEKLLAGASQYLRRLERQRRAAAVAPMPVPQPETQRIIEYMVKSGDARTQLVAAIQQRMDSILSVARSGTLGCWERWN